VASLRAPLAAGEGNGLGTALRRLERNHHCTAHAHAISLEISLQV
jgi:hypothetical protein